jgi:hypothetical protein
VHYTKSKFVPVSKGKLKNIVILTSSPYLTEFDVPAHLHVTDNIYKSSKGNIVTNDRELIDLHGIISVWEYNGIEVLFWLIGQGAVKNASLLANKFLDRFNYKEEEATVEDDQYFISSFKDLELT